nr:retrovirus-related Pol polyprotein from transposon TNT 1-94 [Tanacetum cinerariifolium]
EHLCPSCEQEKSKRVSHPPKPVPNSRQKLHLLRMDLCGPMRIASINGKRYVLVIVDDYSRYTWVHFLRSKDEAPEVIKTFLKRINVLLHSGLDLTYAPSTITTLQPTEGELDLLFEAMYYDYIGGQPSATARKVTAAQEPQDVDELNSQQQHVQQQGIQAHPQFEMVADNVSNAMFDANTFVNPFANPSTGAAESSSSQNVDPSNMHTFYQPYPHEFQWTKDHPLEQVIEEPSRPVLTRNQLRSDGDMCFIDADHPSHVYKLKKALYGLKQAPRAWYDELSTFLLHNHFFKGTIDPMLFIRRFHDDTLVDFGFELTGFSDDDYAGCKDTFKSTSGEAQFLGEKLVSWSSKKQDCTTLSTVESEYVSLSACCTQVLWMRTQLTDYGFHFNKIPIYCDSKSAIAISCNPVQHSRSKHIIVRYHFIKEHVEKGTIELYFVKTDYQLADLFTKALPADRFNYLVRRLGMRSSSPQELERLAKSQ